MKEECTRNASNFEHLPVLAKEVVDSIGILSKEQLHQGLMIDTTLGWGGHSSLALQQNPKLRLIGIDQDPQARTAAEENLMNFKERTNILATNFANFIPTEKAIIVLADLGVSSPQFDEKSRGFSFRLNGPLDMRMNPNSEQSAADIIEELDEESLANIIYKYGEERFSRRIARRIKNDLSKNGPYSGTSALAYAIAGCYPPKKRHGRIHPATKTFQALRIAVNQELDVLDKLLTKSPDWLLPGGLLMIISFHSLEDRKVKQAFQADTRLEKITKKPIIPSKSEVLKNPRSRSAKLRISRRSSNINLINSDE